MAKLRGGLGYSVHAVPGHRQLHVLYHRSTVDSVTAPHHPSPPCLAQPPSTSLRGLRRVLTLDGYTYVE